MSPSRTHTSTSSTSFVEAYFTDTDHAALARRASFDLGIEPVTPAAAHTLTLLTHAINAKAVIEIGTGAGVSSLAFFAGMAEDGVLTTVDCEAEHQMVAREVLKDAGIRHTRYRLITGEALSILPKLRAGAYDVVFIDAEFLEYPEYLEEGLRCVRPGGLVILYHALLSGRVANDADVEDDTMIIRDTLEAARNLDGLTTALIPVGDGLLVCSTARLGAITGS